VLVIALMLVLASGASAGEWIEVSCVNPDQSAAPSEGWSSFSGGAGFGSNNGTGCAPGAPMYALLSTGAAVGVGANETLQYSPPAGSTLIGGSIDVSLFADGFGYNASGTAVAYTPSYAYDGSDVFFQCAAGLTPCSSAGADYSGVLGVPSGRGGNLYLSAGCGGNAGAVCNSGGSEGAWSLVRLWWANLLLESDATPAGSGFGGTLLASEAHGTSELTFAASDPSGPGVYAVIVQLDGKTVYDATPDANGGRCVAVGASGGALMFDHSQPCRSSESVDVPVDTATVPDGQHALKVIVHDAAGNSSVVYDAQISTHNATTSSLGALPGPGSGSGAPSTSPGAANGVGASERAQLHLGVPQALSRSYRHRALVIDGRLLDSVGHPIAGANLELLAQGSGQAHPQPLGQVSTKADGTFTAPVAAGPSRTIELAYRAFANDPAYAAQASVKESVAAGVVLHVSPRRTGPDGQIMLTGRVAGPIPRNGVIVDLLVHYRGQWEPFRTPRTDADGRFAIPYTFQGAVGRFPFRAEVPGRQVGFSFSRGVSGVAYVATG
jgi:5-hydroxyisourate hydrolase-like protein (transthyretin family)